VGVGLVLISKLQIYILASSRRRQRKEEGEDPVLTHDGIVREAFALFWLF
jgi:hypothetical protein